MKLHHYNLVQIILALHMCCFVEQNFFFFSFAQKRGIIHTFIHSGHAQPLAMNLMNKNRRIINQLVPSRSKMICSLILFM